MINSNSGDGALEEKYKRFTGNSEGEGGGGGGLVGL